MKRLGIVDLWRFVFCLLIMAFHQQNFGYEGNFHFNSAWIYVEFFFILTGYFTARHFKSKEDADIAYSMKYFVKKFRGIIPYTIIVFIVQYIITAIRFNMNFLDATLFFFKIPFDAFLLSDTGIIQTQIAPIWYLSAMFITLPFVCYFLTKKKDLYTNILSWVIPLIYYGYMGIADERTWPNDFLRAFACMSLGVWVYAASEKIKTINISKIILTIGEIICFLGAIAITYYEYGNSYSQVFMLLIIIGCIIMFSQKTFTASINSKFISFLGKLSLPLYLCQSTVGRLVGGFFPSWSLTDKTIIYYALTFIYAIIVYGIVHIITRERKIKILNR